MSNRNLVFGIPIIGLFLMALLTFILFKGCEDVLESVVDVEVQMQENVGKRIVLEGDTLTITSFSILDDTYTTKDGTVVKSSFLNEKTLIDE